MNYYNTGGHKKDSEEAARERESNRVTELLLAGLDTTPAASQVLY